MSLNKRSLRKDAKPEVSLADQLREHERHLKSRRGANRRAAFDALRVHDDARAIAAVEALVKSASGKNLAELGGLLVSTSIKRFVDAAVMGKYGDVSVHEFVQGTDLAVAIAGLPALLPSLPPADVERRVRTLGLLPLVDAAKFIGHTPRAYAALLDDERLDLSLRRALAAVCAGYAPSVVWLRRFSDAVDADLAICAGLASRFVEPATFDADRFLDGIARLPRAERTARLRAAGVPASVQGFPALKQIPILAAILDDAGLLDLHPIAGAWLASMVKHPEAREAILARPLMHLSATVGACAMVTAAEAKSVLGPLVRTREDARDAIIRNHWAAPFDIIDDAVSVLAIDPFGAAAILSRNPSPRAQAELETALAAAGDVDCALLLQGCLAHPLNAESTNRAALTKNLVEVFRRCADELMRARSPILARLLLPLLPRAAAAAATVRDALAHVDV